MRWRRGRGDCGSGRRPLLLLTRSQADDPVASAPQHQRNYNLTDALLWGRKEDRRLRDRWGAALRRRMSALVTPGDARECLHGAGRGAT